MGKIIGGFIFSKTAAILDILNDMMNMKIDIGEEIDQFK
jgi:hypothetical protein